jgi:hypothetical protein
VAAVSSYKILYEKLAKVACSIVQNVKSLKEALQDLEVRLLVRFGIG